MSTFPGLAIHCWKNQTFRMLGPLYLQCVADGVCCSRQFKTDIWVKQSFPSGDLWCLWCRGFFMFVATFFSGLLLDAMREGRVTIPIVSNLLGNSTDAVGWYGLCRMCVSNSVVSVVGQLETLEILDYGNAEIEWNRRVQTIQTVSKIEIAEMLQGGPDACSIRVILR